jgi:hypothetical protein
MVLNPDFGVSQPIATMKETRQYSIVFSPDPSE